LGFVVYWLAVEAERGVEGERAIGEEDRSRKERKVVWPR